MGKVQIHRVDVHFSDCDPASTVYFPNFSRCRDPTLLALFMACGLPPWRELVKTRSIVGTPLGNSHQVFEGRNLLIRPTKI